MRGKVVEPNRKRSIGRQEAPVELHVAGHRLDQLDDETAAGAHRDACLPVHLLAAVVEHASGVGGNLQAVLEAESLAHEVHAAVEVGAHVANLPDAREQVGQGLHRPRWREQVRGHTATVWSGRSPRMSTRARMVDGWRSG